MRPADEVVIVSSRSDEYEQRAFYCRIERFLAYCSNEHRNCSCGLQRQRHLTHRLIYHRVFLFFSTPNIAAYHNRLQILPALFMGLINFTCRHKVTVVPEVLNVSTTASETVHQ